MISMDYCSRVDKFYGKFCQLHCSSPQSHGRHWHDTGNVRFGRSGLIERITNCEPSLSVQKLECNACIMHYALCYGCAIMQLAFCSQNLGMHCILLHNQTMPIYGIIP